MQNRSDIIETLKNSTEGGIRTLMKYAERKPRLIIISDDIANPATESYMRNKKNICDQFEIECEVVTSEDVPVGQLASLISGYSDGRTGVIVQLPFYNRTQEFVRTAFEHAEKIFGADVIDVDSFYHTYEKSGRLIDLPATSLAVYNIIKEYSYAKYGSASERLTIAVAGQSELVTKPLAKALIEARHTVLSMNSLSNKRLLEFADVSVLATGQLRSFRPWDFAENGFVIDVSIGRKDGKLCGDLNTVRVDEYNIQYTPVPFGVGQLTTRYLVFKLVKKVNEKTAKLHEETKGKRGILECSN